MPKGDVDHARPILGVQRVDKHGWEHRPPQNARPDERSRKHFADVALFDQVSDVTDDRRSTRLESNRAAHLFILRELRELDCFGNVAAERRGIGAGVLLRALEPLEGISMQRRRGTTRLTELAKGPGRLATAMAIDRRCDGIDLCAAGPLWLGVDERRAVRPSRSVRIGLTKEVYRLLRFYERGNVYVNGPRKLCS